MTAGMLAVLAENSRRAVRDEVYDIACTGGRCGSLAAAVSPAFYMADSQ